MSKMLRDPESIAAVGLDVHKHVVQVCVLDRAGQVPSSRRVANDIEAISAVMYRHARRANVALECGGGTAALADALSQRTARDVHLCHPGYVRRMRQNPDKTDLSDAHLLADLVRVGYLPRVWLAPPAFRVRDGARPLRLNANRSKHTEPAAADPARTASFAIIADFDARMSPNRDTARRRTAENSAHAASPVRVDPRCQKLTAPATAQ